jgi:hypothetical protein
MGGDSANRKWDIEFSVVDFSNEYLSGQNITDTKGKGKDEDAWNGGTRGYPRCGAFFQGRLVVAGSLALPNALWTSRSGNIYDFNKEETLADYGIFYFIGSNEANPIVSVVADKHLMVFSEGYENFVPVSRDKGITPENFSVIPTSAKGSKLGIRPYDVGGSLFFVDRSGCCVYESAFTDQSQSYEVSLLSKLSTHFFDDVRSISYTKAESSLETDFLYCVNSDGSLVCLATLLEDNVAAWSLHTTKGWFWETASDSHTSVFAVWRDSLTADGAPTSTSTLHFESFDEELFVDCAIKTGDFTAEGGTNAASFTFDHLDNGTTLQVVAGSVDLYRYKGELDTAAGSGDCWPLFDTIEKDGVGTNVYDNYQAGLEFPVVHGTEDTVWVQLLPHDTGAGQNSVRGERTSIQEAVLQVYKSIHARVGVNDDTQYEAITLESSTAIAPSTVSEIYDSYEWFTGNVSVSGLQNWDETSKLSITQRLPLPLQVLAVVYKVVN